MDAKEVRNHMAMAATALNLMMPEGLEVVVMVIDAAEKKVLACVATCQTEVAKAAAGAWAPLPKEEAGSVLVTLAVATGEMTVVDDDGNQEHVH